MKFQYTFHQNLTIKVWKNQTIYKIIIYFGTCQDKIR